MHTDAANDKSPLTSSLSDEKDAPHARSGGISDPRNGTMMKMFNLIDIGERADSGIPSIFSVWKQQGWSEPTITVSSEPDRSTLILPLVSNYYDKTAIKIGDNDSQARYNHCIPYGSSGCQCSRDRPRRGAEIFAYSGLSHFPNEIEQFASANVRSYVTFGRESKSHLINEGTVVAEGGNRNRTYRLKS